MPTDRSYDLIVIGGGPAGGSAAITAARAGAKTLLLERGSFPRHKVCGEFVSPESLDLLASLFPGTGKAIMERAPRIRLARLFLDGLVLQTPIEPAAASIARIELDALLWDVATQAGVETRERTTAHGISGNGPFTVRVNSGEDLSARAVMNASGRWSNLTPLKPTPSNRKNTWIGLKGHFAEERPDSSVDLYFFDGGYCGVSPVRLAQDASDDGRVNAAAMVRTGVGTTLQDVFRACPPLRDRSAGWRPIGDPVATSHLHFRRPSPADKNLLLVGDAAGFVDPFVGDGIALALRGGVMAGRCLAPFLRGETSLESAVAEYCRFYERSLLPVFRTASRVRSLFTLPKPVRLMLIPIFRGNPWLLQSFLRRTRSREARP